MPSIMRLLKDIEASRRRLLETILALDPETAAAPVAEGRWSPIEYLEHLVRAEETTLWRMFKAVEDWRTSGEALRSPTPDSRIEDIVDRTWNVREKAPPLAVPSLGASRSYWSERMRRNEALVSAFAELVEEAELDDLAYPHPISGPFTLRQGLEFIRFHLDRHHGHVLEARPGAPPRA